jgi:hypothetical protein
VGEISQQLNKLRSDLSDAELEPWVVFPKQYAEQSREPILSANVLFSQAPPEQQKHNQQAALEYAGLEDLERRCAEFEANRTLLDPLVIPKAKRDKKRLQIAPKAELSIDAKKLRKWMDTGIHN